MERRPLVQEEERESSPTAFVSSGCKLLDCVLGGGYPVGRVVNVAGDRSTGKTLLAIEACSNFAKQFPGGRIRYIESEAAFDESYAESLGMPVERVQFVDDILTVEELYDDLVVFCKDVKVPSIVIVDSLDALSDKAEQERGIEEGSYGGNKAKKMGEMFRRLIKPLREASVLLIIISQLRDKVGVSFGETQMRSGGRALDFYASQILWLAEVGKIRQEVRGVERAVGVNVRALCKKNKVGPAFRSCDFPILFNYGIDDLTAGVEWLKSAAKLDIAELGLNDRSFRSKLKSLRNEGGPELVEFRTKLSSILESNWAQIETEFLPKRRKY